MDGDEGRLKKDGHDNVHKYDRDLDYKDDDGDGVDSDQPIHSCQVEGCLLSLEVAHLINKTSSAFIS